MIFRCSYVLSILLLSIDLSGAVHAQESRQRPNILFAFADDWGRYASAYAGLDGVGTFNDVVRTPHFDRVARQGVIFRDAFVSAPSCTPCRSALVSGQPFCFWFGPTNVHRKWIRGSGKTLWDIDPDTLKGKMPPFLPDVPEVRQDLADYFGEIAAFDAALGLLLQRLEEIGELDNTLVVVSGDHGAPGFPYGKCNLYDFGASVPLAIRWGQNVPAGRVVDDLVSLTDLAPTFLELGGVQIPKRMTGRSLVNVLRSDKSGQVDPRRTAVFIGRERHVENARADFTPYPQRAIRTHDFLYIVNFRPDRWPLGDPYRLDGDNPPTVEELTEVTRTTLPDEERRRRSALHCCA